MRTSIAILAQVFQVQLSRLGVNSGFEQTAHMLTTLETVTKQWSATRKRPAIIMLLVAKVVAKGW